MLGELHVFSEIVLFFWHALTAYVSTPAGAAELATLEQNIFPAETPAETPASPPNSAPSGSSVRR